LIGEQVLFLTEGSVDEVSQFVDGTNHVNDHFTHHGGSRFQA
jgi:hypothetical protein